jgi:hypothetical protein
VAVMADIFVSWGSPDRETIDLLVDRLKALGLSFYNYRRDMPGGGEIPREVIREIHQAKIALLCMSDASVGRDWLQRELYWCYMDYVDDDRPMRRLIPVVIGELSAANLPRLLAETGLHRFHLSQADSLENDLERLVHDLQIGIGEPLPLVIPGTVLAVNREIAEGMMDAEERLLTVRELCRIAGMDLEDGWAESCLARYGSTAEEFRPFSAHETVVDAVHRAVGDLNRGRRESPPIAIHWYSHALLTEQSDAGQLARRHWRHDAQLLIVDALSLLNSGIRSDLTEILALTRNDSDAPCCGCLPTPTTPTGYRI